MTVKEFPILDVQTHANRLSEYNYGLDPWHRCMIAAWHQAAIDALALGYEHDMNSPAAVIDGELVPVEDTVLLEIDDRYRHVPTPKFRRKAA